MSDEGKSTKHMLKFEDNFVYNKLFLVIPVISGYYPQIYILSLLTVKFMLIY